MWLVLSLACPIGAALGLAQFRVWTLIPTTAILALITAVVSAGSGVGTSRIVLVVFCTAMLLQVTYLVGSVFSDKWSDYPTSTRIPEKELLGIVRTAIATELRAHFEPPLDDLPPQLREKLALIETS